MKYLFNKLSMVLPSKIFYTTIPIIYASNDKEVICLYAFDKRKRVILVSNYYFYDFRYMSIYEFMDKNYKLISSKYAVEGIHHKLIEINH